MENEEGLNEFLTPGETGSEDLSNMDSNSSADLSFLLSTLEESPTDSLPNSELMEIEEHPMVLADPEAIDVTPADPPVYRSKVLQRLEHLGVSTPKTKCGQCQAGVWMREGKKDLTCFCRVMSIVVWTTNALDEQRQIQLALEDCDGPEMMQARG